MKDYEHLETQFRRVRRAWKRMAALSGLALVVLESIGIITLAILLNLFYGHIPYVRFGLFAVGALLMAVLLVRHVVLPVLRRIPDEQVALYVEEHDEKFEGSLITAAEFGRKVGASPLQMRMIEAVVQLADRRAQRVRPAALVSLERLRKYGMAALVCLGTYVAMCAAFPSTVGRHVVGALQPWRQQPPSLLGPDGRPLGPGLSPEEARRLQPIDFKLSGGDVRIARGEDFPLQAELSRRPDGPVVLSFRSVADPKAPGQWQRLKMAPVEKLNGFARKLEAVSEDMEYRVSSGEHASPKYRITVYDRIELRGVEITTKYPAYLGFPDRVGELSSGDVSAPIGSTVTVRILVNTELASGKLTWEDGTRQPLAVDPQRKNSASASFPVQTSRRYAFEVTDIDGQTAKSLGASEVYALKDNPPMLDLLFPTAELETHPLGEVAFRARLTDDFGTDRAELVYLRFGPQGAAEARLPMQLGRTPNPEVPLPDVADATLRFLLETVQPAFRPGEVISWYLEARDRKPDNPPAMSELHMISVLPFELWGAYEFAPGELPEPETSDVPFTLAELLMEVWSLHRQRGLLKQADFEKQAEGIAGKMVSPATGKLYDLGAAALPPHPTPRMVEAAKRAQKHVEEAHTALLNFDTEKAARHLRLGVAELVAAGIADTETLTREGPMPEGDAAGGAAKRQASRLLEMFADVKMELEDKAGSKIEASLAKAEAAAKARAAVQDVRKQQEGVVNQAKELARSGEGDAGKGRQLEGLGKREGALADRAKGTAGELKRAGGEPNDGFQKAAGKLEDAAAAMTAASGHLQRGETSQAVTKATEADKLLGEADGDLNDMRFDQLATALAEAEALAERLLADQSELRRQTEGVDKEAAAAGQPTAKHKRELKKHSLQQAALRAAAETFDQRMDKLQGWAAQTARSDTAKAVQDAQRTLKRTQPGQKMANAVVELNEFRSKPAIAEQKEAENGLTQTLAKLREASDTLAATREEGLKRALREAKAVQAGVEQIARADRPAEGEGQPGKSEKGQKGAKGQEQGAKAGKGGDQAGGDQTGQRGKDEKGGKAGKSGDQAGGDQAGQTGKGEKGGKGGKGGSSDTAVAGTGLPTPGERREISHKIAVSLERLDRQLQLRDFGLGNDAELLRRVSQDETLEAKLVGDVGTQQRLREIIGRVADKLEAELESTAKAKRILAAQEEDCPPRYRLLVNKYYEALSRRPR